MLGIKFRYRIMVENQQNNRTEQILYLHSDNVQPIVTTLAKYK